MKKFILIVSLLYGIFFMSNSLAKDFNYSIRVGAPVEYEMVYDFNQNYFFDESEKPILYYTAVGGSPSNAWGEGTQATTLFDKVPLPNGIHVRWFSVAEDQFWEVSYPFDQKLLKKLSDYTVVDVIDRTQNSFIGSAVFTVYAVPGGLVTVWVSGGAETYLLAQFQARKVNEPDWDSFAKSTLQRREPISREEYIKERFNRKNSAMATVTKKQLEQGKLPTNSLPWKRLMYTYDWSLTVNDEFKLKDYWAWYVNGEKLFTYSNSRQPLTRAVPYFISFYIEKNNNEKMLNRLNISFDKNEIMQAFEKLAKESSLNEDIKLHLNIDPNFDEMKIFVMKGKISIELENIKVSLEDLYSNT